MTDGNRIFYHGYRQDPVTNSLQNKYTFDLDLGIYRGSKFLNSPFYPHFMADAHVLIRNLDRASEVLKVSKLFVISSTQSFLTVSYQFF